APRMASTQLSQSFTATAQRSWRSGNEHRNRRGQSIRDSEPRGGSGQAFCATPGALVGCRDDRYTNPFFAMEVFGDGLADMFMGETHQHIDGRRSQIPGFDHWDIGLDQAAPAAGREHDARLLDNVRTAGVNGVDLIVVCLSDVHVWDKRRVYSRF